jgi:hypothetical protein
MGSAGFRVLVCAVSVICRTVDVHDSGSVQGVLEA